MTDMQVAMLFLDSAVEKMMHFDYKKLIPKGRIDKSYPHGAVGIEFTWPWRREGFGLGVGLGTFDVWVGWPRTSPIKSVKELEPVDS